MALGSTQPLIEMSTRNLQPPAHAGSSLADFSTMKMEAISSSETSVHATSTQPHIPEDDILHSHRCENLKSLHLPILFSTKKTPAVG
jgi:hypothetical protein